MCRHIDEHKNMRKLSLTDRRTQGRTDRNKRLKTRIEKRLKQNKINC